MRNRVERQSAAFRRALTLARDNGVTLKNIIPKVEKIEGLKQITGYYVIDETGSTTVATVMI